MTAPALTLRGRPSRLDTDPLTRNQLGRIHLEFARLGYADPWDRAERLAATAALARSGPITTTKALTMGQAGRVVKALLSCDDADDLAELLAPPPGRPAARSWWLSAAAVALGIALGAA